MNRIACVYLGGWPIQRLVVAQPALRRQRIVLYTHSARGQRVSAVSPAAQRERVRVGMPLSEARSILRDGAGGPRRGRTSSESNSAPAHFFAHDPEADRRALVDLGLSCESFAPRIGVEPGPQPEALFLEVAGVAHLFGGEQGLQQSLQRHLQQSGYTARIALAETIGQAWGLARFGDGQQTFSRLSIAALRLRPETEQTLRQLGVERIDQLQQLPRADLWARFGDEIHRRLDQASGVRDEVLDWIPPPIDDYAQQFLDFPTSDAAVIELLLGQMLQTLCRQLRTRQRGGLQWQCRLGSPDRPPLQLSIHLFQPTADPRHVLPLIRLQLEQSGLSPARYGRSPGGTDEDEPFAVHHLSLAVTHSVLLVDRQRLLFDENPRLDKQQLAHLIDRLSARMGSHRILGARLVSQAQPELACGFEPLVGSSAARRRTAAPAAHRSPLQRPIHLHTPQEIEVTTAGATGRPVSITNDGRRQPVADCWGPERIETGWWRGTTARRDYWRVALEDGRWLWLFRDLLRDRWFCQGTF